VIVMLEWPMWVLRGLIPAAREESDKPQTEKSERGQGNDSLGSRG
jgi:hypothetical protein